MTPQTGEEKTVIHIQESTAQESAHIFPAHLWTTEEDKLPLIITNIQAELVVQLEKLHKEKKLVEAQRLEQRTNYDLEMLRETGSFALVLGLQDSQESGSFLRCIGSPPNARFLVASGSISCSRESALWF